MLDLKRIVSGLIMGAFLGIFCIIGVGDRVGFSGNEIFLIGMWYNRVIMGLVIGLAGGWVIIQGEGRNYWLNALVRGLVFGILVSSAIYLSTEFRDFPGLIAGFVYGPIIDIVASWVQKRGQ